MKRGWEEDYNECSKGDGDEELNRDGGEIEDRQSKTRRKHRKRWGDEETLQLLELRKEIVETSAAQGSAIPTWKQFAQKLAVRNPGSQARLSSQIAGRWYTLEKTYVSIKDECSETGKSAEEVIVERQSRYDTRYSPSWHALVAQGNPVKRQNDKIVALTNKAPARSANGDSNIQALTPSEAFCLEVDQKNWLMGIQGSSAVFQMYQEISEQCIRADLVSADLLTNSAAWGAHHHHNNLTQQTSSLTSLSYPKNHKRSEESSSSRKRIGDSAKPPTASTTTIDSLSDMVLWSPLSDCAESQVN